jgi:tetratricopeptide (TPR) repeat protein
MSAQVETPQGEMTLFSGYNYLGLGSDERVVQRTVEAVQRFGTHAGAARMVGGEIAIHGELERAIAIFDNQVGDANIYQQLANYYIKKGNKSKALPYLQKALNSEPENLELIKNTSLLLLDSGNYEGVEDVVADALELYPSQPLLYLTYGVALNKQSKFKAAIDQLELGVDYVIDDLKMEMDFYRQLGDAHTGDGDATKANRYYTKVKELQAQGN